MSSGSDTVQGPHFRMPKGYKAQRGLWGSLTFSQSSQCEPGAYRDPLARLEVGWAAPWDPHPLRALECEAIWEEGLDLSQG